jgi:RNA polymerase sigma factor (sigma-70 family)
MREPQVNAAHVEESSATLLYDRYAAIVFASLRRRVVSREDAEDLLVDVFVAAMEQQHLAAIPEEERLAWLQRVGHHKVVDYYRRKARRPVVTLEEVPAILEADEDLDPQNVALRQEAQRGLHTAFQQLPKLQQDVLRLRFAAGLRSAEIASVLGKRDGAIRMLLSRTLNLLRTLYEE